MTETSLLVVCIAALLAVFLILSVLAGVIRLLSALFPEASDDGDAAVLAAIHAAARLAHPGTRVTRIEEIR